MTSQPVRSLYEVLGVKTSATTEEIRKAYRVMALQLHPDKNKEATSEAFQELGTAHAVLSDADRRRVYDLTGQDRDADHVHFPASGASTYDASTYDASTYASPFGGFGFGFGRTTTGVRARANDDSPVFKGFGDLFDEAINAATRSQADTLREKEKEKAQQKQQQKQVIVEVPVSMRDVKHGCVKRVYVNVREQCTDCDGTGIRDPELRFNRCSLCNGKGTVDCGIASFVTIQIKCGVCKGACNVAAKPARPDKSCDRCDSRGSWPVKRHLTIKLPPGVSDGKHHVVDVSSNASPDEVVLLRIVHDRTTFLTAPPHGDDGGGHESLEAFDARVSEVNEDGDVHVEVPLDLREVLIGFRKRVHVMGDAFELGEVGRYVDPTDPVVFEGEGLSKAVRDKKKGDLIFHYVVQWPKRAQQQQQQQHEQNHEKHHEKNNKQEHGRATVTRGVRRIDKYRDVLARIFV
jgi:molecular chaperone DnaJ